MKKGQSISINTIIIAAIGLAVLVVLFAIFTGRIGNFTRGVQGTDTCAQKCISLNLRFQVANTQEYCTNTGGQYIAGKYSDTQDGACCCIQ